MGSKGRFPPYHLRRPLPGPGIGHHDPFAPAVRPGAFPPYDMLPPPEVMEQKLAAQHMEMQKLATENQRLAATHGTMREDLAAMQHELHMLRNHVGAMKSEREQQIMGLLDKIGKMEAELQGAESLELELQQARADAQSLISTREELVSRVQQLTEDHQRAHMDLQQVPALMSELEGLRHEYQHCRATYEYERKLYNEHLESLQVMEKNYMTMSTEVEKLRAELTRYADVDRRAGGHYAGFAGYGDKDASGHYPVGQNTFGDAYGVPQAPGSLPGGGAASAAPADGNTPVLAQSGATAVRAGYDVQRGGPAGPGYNVQRGSGSGHDMHKGSGVPAYDQQGGPAGPAYNHQRGHSGSAYDSQIGPGGPAYGSQRVPGGAAHDSKRGPSGAPYDSQTGPGGPPYDSQRGPGVPYDAQKGPSAHSYNMQRGTAGHGYDTYRGPGGPGYDQHMVSGGSGYDMQRGQVYDVQRGSNPDAQRGTTYEGQRGPNAQRGAAYEVHRGTRFGSPQAASGPQGQAVQQANNANYGSVTPPTRAGASGPQGQEGPQANNAAYGSAPGNIVQAPPPPPPPRPADGNQTARR